MEALRRNILRKYQQLLKRKLIRIKKYYQTSMKRRRESVATVYKRTTKFLTSNTANLLKKTMPNTKKYRFLEKAMERAEQNRHFNINKQYDCADDEKEDEYEGDQLDYFFGLNKKQTFWRDLEGEEQIRKDYYINHCGVSEEDYDLFYKKINFKKPTCSVQPKLKQVPFKIHKKMGRKNSYFRKDHTNNFWCEKTGILKMFMTNRKDSEYSSSDSYSECEPSQNASDSEQKNCDDFDLLTNHFNRLQVHGLSDFDLGSLEVSLVK